MSLFRVVLSFLSLVQGLIHIPAGIAANNVRGIGSFLSAGIWSALGLPALTNVNGWAALAKQLLVKLGVADLTTSAGARAFVDSVLDQLATVSAKTPIKLDDLAIAGLRKLLADDDAWSLLWTVLSGVATQTDHAATLHAALGEAQLGGLSDRATSLGLDWSKIAPVLTALLTFFQTVFHQSSDGAQINVIPVPTPSPAPVASQSAAK